MAPRFNIIRAHIVFFVLFTLCYTAKLYSVPIDEKGHADFNSGNTSFLNKQSAKNITSASYFVNAAAGGTNNGGSWQNAYTSLATALTNSVAGDTIRVAQGIYVPVSGPFVLKDSVVLLGGYANSGNPSDIERNYGIYQTILSGEIGNPQIVFDNLGIVVSGSLLHSTTVVDGFIIERGFAYNTFQGAGLDLLNSSPLIKNCVFRDNSSYNTLLGGSSIACRNNSNPSVINCYFVNNLDFGFGTIFSKGNSNPQLFNCVFSKNDCRSVVFAVNSEVSITNCTFFNNQTGKAILPYNIRTGVLYADSNSVLNVTNSVFFKNKFLESYDSTDISLKNSTITITNTITQNYNTGNAYLVGVDPQFKDIVNVAGADQLYFSIDDGLQLQSCSPAINAGINTVPGTVSVDLLQHPRVFNLLTDIGAYEYQAGNGDNILSVANDSLVANRELTDQFGWTHYYNDCSLLLSVKKNGQQIGVINDGTFKVTVKTTPAYGSGTGTSLSNAAYVTPGVSWNILNRYWTINATTQPADSVMVRFPFATKDFTDASGVNPAVGSPQQLVFFTIDTANSLFDPAIPIGNFHSCFNSVNATTQTWKYSVTDTINYAEYYVKKLNGGGIGTGSGLNKGPFALAINTCPGTDRVFTASLAGDSYQWQINSGNGFINIADNSSYSGTGSNILSVITPAGTAYGNIFRCQVTNANNVLFTPEMVMKFESKWTGTISTDWNQPENWSCGVLPDANTDVVVAAGTPFNLEVNINATCRSLRLMPNCIASIASGKTITITGK